MRRRQRKRRRLRDGRGLGSSSCARTTTQASAASRRSTGEGSPPDPLLSVAKHHRQRPVATGRHPSRPVFIAFAIPVPSQADAPALLDEPCADRTRDPLLKSGIRDENKEPE
jgi:hypothetical protein